MWKLTKFHLTIKRPIAFKIQSKSRLNNIIIKKDVIYTDIVCVKSGHFIFNKKQWAHAIIITYYYDIE